ncbi:MAG: glutamate-5-semialdehyde dehydrogenase [Lachnospiraceae bacterium]|nr:glutamate-5-semialdehyde dehydrogenase [Lachnospiraceae bacterium]
MSNYIESLGKKAKAISREVAKLTMDEKNAGLVAVAEELCKQSQTILKENAKDIQAAKDKGISEALIDRLRLSEARIVDMAEGLRQISALNDPIGDMRDIVQRPNGLKIGKMQVPLGVIGIIYESRPNVTADAFGLCFKTGNAVILRGGSDALNSNKAIVQAIWAGLCQVALPQDALLLVDDVSREIATEMMRLHKYIDVLIPRGGAGLIENVVENSTVPVIETGTGNCHIYVDEFADLDMAVQIIENAKTQRLGVCNTAESLVIHRKILKEILPKVEQALFSHGIEIRGDASVLALSNQIKAATEEDWGMEYLDGIISMRVVDSLDEAIAHINQYNTGHSDAIITENYHNGMKFHREIDAAAVYINASTRFTDGFVFGFGAEIGISTQKLHARGPMGLDALTTTKYVIFGDGQIR